MSDRIFEIGISDIIEIAQKRATGGFVDDADGTASARATKRSLRHSVHFHLAFLYSRPRLLYRTAESHTSRRSFAVFFDLIFHGG